jgi:redox-sensitive bicupin YhaK (pirin superfamily)
MITIRPANERGVTQLGWLDSRHSFSFADYADPAHMGFGPLRVINDDRVAPRGGFGTHPHRDMEILTYVLSGSLQHKDSMGTGSIIRPGDVQRMTAGTGVTHSEFNPSATESVHLLQIWVFPERRGLQPSYAQKSFNDAEKKGKLCLVASQTARDGSVSWQQDADLYVAKLANGDKVSHNFRPGRIGWLHVANGAVLLNGQQLHGGDGAAIREEDSIELTGVEESEVLLFDMK